MHKVNVVIGKPLVEPSLLFSRSMDDWENIEKDLTLFTREKFLPYILVTCGVFQSTSEVKRNRPDLWKELDTPDFMEIKIGKKRIWICVGEA